MRLCLVFGLLGPPTSYAVPLAIGDDLDRVS
jgi:hypothetical protein